MTLVTWVNSLNSFTNKICAEKEIMSFCMGNRFNKRQVNNFVVNQVMSTCENKFWFFKSKFGQLQFAQI